jgi:hypothetical protein
MCKDQHSTEYTHNNCIFCFVGPNRDDVAIAWWLFMLLYPVTSSAHVVCCGFVVLGEIER